MQQAILCADPLELVVMLYEGLGESIQSARQALSAGNIPGRAAATSKALEIVAELSAALDRDRGGEIASNLARLYAYISERLQEGNFSQQDRAFAEAGQVAATLLEAWRELRPARMPENLATSTASFGMSPLATLSACG